MERTPLIPQQISLTDKSLFNQEMETVKGNMLRSIILEAISGVYTKPTAKVINTAIDNHWPAVIKYNSKGEGKHLGYRMIFPVAYGLTKAGNPVVRAYQTSEQDTTTKAPAWKFFRLDRIVGWKSIKSPIVDTKKLTGFNSSGDMTMSKVFNISTLGRVKKVKKVADGTKPAEISYEPITKDSIKTNASDTPVTAQTQSRMTADDVVNDILDNMDNAEKKSTPIDNNTKSYYSSEENDNVSRMRNDDTEPIQKSDIENSGTENDKSKENDNASRMHSDDKPYMKSDFVNDYKSMLNRMDKSLKGENAQEEEDDNS